MTEPRDVDPQAVLDALDNLDDDGNPKPKPQPEPKAKPEPVLFAPATTDPSLRMAWSLAEDAVKDLCPDLDDEDKLIARDAAAGDPVKFKDTAKRMQAKIKAAKTPTPAKTQDQLKADLAGKIFDGGGPGGDDSLTPKPTAPSTQEKLEKAVKDGDRRDIMGGLADTVKDGKLFRGVQIVE